MSENKLEFFDYDATINIDVKDFNKAFSERYAELRKDSKIRFVDENDEVAMGDLMDEITLAGGYSNFYIGEHGEEIIKECSPKNVRFERIEICACPMEKGNDLKVADFLPAIDNIVKMEEEHVQKISAVGAQVVFIVANPITALLTTNPAAGECGFSIFENIAIIAYKSAKIGLKATEKLVYDENDPGIKTLLNKDS